MLRKKSMERKLNTRNVLSRKNSQTKTKLDGKLLPHTLIFSHLATNTLSPAVGQA